MMHPWTDKQQSRGLHEANIWSNVFLVFQLSFPFQAMPFVAGHTSRAFCLLVSFSDMQWRVFIPNQRNDGDLGQQPIHPSPAQPSPGSSTGTAPCVMWEGAAAIPAPLSIIPTAHCAGAWPWQERCQQHIGYPCEAETVPSLILFRYLPQGFLSRMGLTSDLAADGVTVALADCHSLPVLNLTLFSCYSMGNPAPCS